MFVQALLRGLNAGLLMLGLSCFIFMVMAWLHVDDIAVLRKWFGLLPYTAIFLVFFLSPIRNLKRRPQSVGFLYSMSFGVVPLVVIGPLGTVVILLIRYANEATAANIPDWLRINVLFAAFLMTIIAAMEWAWLRRSAYVEDGKK